MSTTQMDALAGIERAIHGFLATQKNHGDLLRALAEGPQEIIKLLTPEAKDGPTLDELPGDIVRALAAAAHAAPATNGTGRSGQRS